MTKQEAFVELARIEYERELLTQREIIAKSIINKKYKKFFKSKT